MKKTINKIHLLILFILILIWQVVFAVPISAADPAGSATNTAPVATATPPAKDSDFDGLIDSAETDKFKTDFLKWDTDSDGYSDGAEVVINSNPLDKDDPAAYLAALENGSGTAAEPQEQNSILPALPWLISRSSALTAFILMFLVIFIGTGITTDFILRFFSPDFSWSIHRYLSIGMVVSVAAHVISLLFDKFINFGWKDVLLPFYSNFHPAVLSAGIFAAYLLVVIMLTSIYLVERTPRFWKAVHYLTYPLFALSLWHGLYIGTDSKLPAVKIIYLVTGALAATLLVYRLIYIFWRGRHKQPPRRKLDWRGRPGLT